MKKLYFTLSFLLHIIGSALANEPVPNLTTKTYYMCAELWGENILCHKVWVGVFQEDRLVGCEVITVSCELNLN